MICCIKLVNEFFSQYSSLVFNASLKSLSLFHMKAKRRTFLKTERQERIDLKILSKGSLGTFTAQFISNFVLFFPFVQPHRFNFPMERLNNNYKDKIWIFFTENVFLNDEYINSNCICL